MAGKAIIVMGSERDLDFSREIAKYLKLLGVDYEFRVASAHKTPLAVLEILKEFEDQKVVYVTVAGRSNALSAFMDGNTAKACYCLSALQRKIWRSRHLLFTSCPKWHWQCCDD